MLWILNYVPFLTLLSGEILYAMKFYIRLSWLAYLHTIYYIIDEYVEYAKVHVCIYYVPTEAFLIYYIIHNCPSTLSLLVLLIELRKGLIFEVEKIL